MGGAHIANGFRRLASQPLASLFEDISFLCPMVSRANSKFVIGYYELEKASTPSETPRSHAGSSFILYQKASTPSETPSSHAGSSFILYQLDDPLRHNRRNQDRIQAISSIPHFAISSIPHFILFSMCRLCTHAVGVRFRARYYVEQYF
jgi:hypothetical protein